MRTSTSFLSTLIFSFLFGSWFIKVTRKHFGARISNRPPDKHLKKSNTPALGGVFMISILIINILLWNNLYNKNVWLFILCVISFGLIGLLDDLQKIRAIAGITAHHKLMLQFGAASIITVTWYWWTNPTTSLCVPFFKNIMPCLGVAIIPWGILLFIAVSNAVNLTDGLDGLATGSLISIYTAYGLICYVAGHTKFAQYLAIPYTQSNELTVITGSVLGTLLGFLWYNAYPAQVFMGDVGSLALGAGLAFIALVCRQELLLIIGGGIFVLETVSVIIQVASYKLRKKRVFRMAPIHHHFELQGWNEPKITIRFWIISIILAVITLMTLKIR